jgi:hypothetical protein
MRVRLKVELTEIFILFLFSSFCRGGAISKGVTHEGVLRMIKRFDISMCISWGLHLGQQSVIIISKRHFGYTFLVPFWVMVRL